MNKEPGGYSPWACKESRTRDFQTWSFSGLSWRACCNKDFWTTPSEPLTQVLGWVWEFSFLTNSQIVWCCPGNPPLKTAVVDYSLRSHTTLHAFGIKPQQKGKSDLFLTSLTLAFILGHHPHTGLGMLQVLSDFCANSAFACRAWVKLELTLSREEPWTNMDPSLAHIYHLNSLLSDNRHQEAKVPVAIRVLDVNDNAPKFAAPYEGFICESDQTKPHSNQVMLPCPG